MSLPRSQDYLRGLVNELRKASAENEWLEFKVNNDRPELIGEYVSALSNSPALAGKSAAYVVWGVDDSSHDVVGTAFDPAAAKQGNEELESWLLRLLSPKLHFEFHRIACGDKTVIVLEIESARALPTSFQGVEYIRVGSYKKKLKDTPEKERALWRIFDLTPFERGVAAENIAVDDVLRLIDYPSYFELINAPLPESRSGILAALRDDELVTTCDTGNLNVSNLGAILFAKDLGRFPTLRRKMMRVIVYEGTGRLITTKEYLPKRGYATGFRDLVAHVTDLLPTNEVIRKALRVSTPMYPELALRELIANALIHQDFGISGAGPMVEVFIDRIEITNPGTPLMEPDRFVDTPPKSRNEALASLMRRMGICEERGSGVDKVVSQTEVYQLPAPLFERTGESTRSILFSHRPLSKMDRNDRVRACYLHACLKYVSRESLTNASLRERFGVDTKNSAMISRFIKEAVDAGRIIAEDENAGRRFMSYVPWWAKPDSVD